MAEVELRDIAKLYGNVRVIDGMNLTVPDGSFTVFVGPSGCGKSTLLRMIAGLEPISDGDLLIGGRRANDETPTARGVSMVFQNYALYPHMTVERNIGFGLKMGGMGRAEIARRVGSAAESLQLTPYLSRKPSALSGGQRQRVAIGRAIVREPRVFLFDEPLSNLDAELRVSMRIEIARLHRELGVTMIYVTHDQTEAMTLADRIVVLNKGRVEQVGTPQELYEQPDNTFVAGFIGSPRMNLIDVDTARADLATASLPPGAARLGIRPEHIRVGGGQEDAHIAVEAVEYLGGTRFVYGRLASGAPITVELRGQTIPAPGEMLPISLPPEALHCFDASGMRLGA